jgi:serine/threonine protein kinase
MTSDTAGGGATINALLRINRWCDEFEAAWRAGGAPRTEEYLTRAGADAPALFEYLLPIELAYRRARGKRPAVAEYAARFPNADRAALARLLLDYGGAIPPVLGEYELVRPLGSGGMGVVYLARHRRMNRAVALKAVPPDAPHREQLLRRFAREVELTARLEHPNVVPALDAREDAGVAYLVTAFVEGGDLGRLVRANGPLPVPVAVRFARDAALGLAHAHARGVVHRDVKPSNLLIDAHERVSVADWGLARDSGSAPGASSAPPLTEAGVVLGTVDYLAPEQAERSDRADARSDVYSLGCVLFFLLTGRPPFAEGGIEERVTAHRTAPPPDLDAPAALGALVARMLAKRPDARPASMAAVVAALDALSEQPSRRAVLLGACAALGAAGVAVWQLVPRRDPEPPPRERPPIRELPLADSRAYQREWADFLGVPVERTDAARNAAFHFVLIPPGTFRMGSPADVLARVLAQPNLGEWARERYRGETERRVTIRRAFYLGVTEITVAQFGAFVAHENYETTAERAALGWGYRGTGVGFRGAGAGWELARGFNWRAAGDYAPAADHPVVNTSHADALRLCKWLSAATGGTCRLPAESEWEFACRAGRYGLWAHGDDAEQLKRFAVYGTEVPARVASRAPNAFGLFDMLGNLSERCALEDPWADDPHRPTNLDAAICPVRGGRFNELSADAFPEAYRVARRAWEPQDALTAGFRVLREISQ